MPTAPGTFASVDPGFATVLWDVAVSVSEPLDRFVGRNFLLDEAVPAGRAASYLSGGTPSALHDWRVHDRAYAARRLRIPPVAGRIPAAGGSVPLAEVPETFDGVGDGVLLDGSESLSLVRVESVATLARAAGLDVDQMVDELSGAPGFDPSTRVWLSAVLDSYAQSQLQRPIYAGFLDDLPDLGGTPSEGLAYLRDRFGLLHYDPAVVGAVALAVFIYPVGDLPMLGTDGSRALVVPTVLESGMNPAFFPAPNGSNFGTAVDLGVPDRWPAREVLHLAFRYKPEHLKLAGILKAPVTRPMHECRVRHIKYLRAVTGSSIASSTDSDLVV